MASIITHLPQNTDIPVRGICDALLSAGFIEEDEHDAIVGRAAASEISINVDVDIGALLDEVTSEQLISVLEDRGDYDPRPDREGDLADFLREALQGNRSIAMALIGKVTVDDREAVELEEVLRAHCRPAETRAAA